MSNSNTNNNGAVENIFEDHPEEDTWLENRPFNPLFAHLIESGGERNLFSDNHKGKPPPPGKKSKLHAPKVADYDFVKTSGSGSGSGSAIGNGNDNDSGDDDDQTKSRKRGRRAQSPSVSASSSER